MDLVAPPLKTRLACMLYESMLVLGLVFGAGLLFSVVMQQRHALFLRGGMQAWLFFIMAMYFVWFWSHGRQTLPMKTWYIRLVDRFGQPVGYGRALLRYLLCWLWVLPGLILVYLLGTKHWMSVLIPAANMALWALTIYLDPQRQFLHDRIAGTRLVRVAAPT